MSKELNQPFARPTVNVDQPRSLVQFFQESPLVGVELDLERDRDTGRGIELEPKSPVAGD